MTGATRDKLRIGFVGTGFIAHFHLRALVGVRNVDVTGVFSRTAANRERVVQAVAALGLLNANRKCPALTCLQHNNR